MYLKKKEIEKIRKKIYSKGGFYIIKDFLNKEDLQRIQADWNGNISYAFHGFIKNRKVSPGSPKYMYNHPSEDDFAYCTQIWNEPYDELLHNESLKIQIMRNQVEGKPLYYGLHESTGKALQYRVCKTVSPGYSVKQHADFFEEYRPDPTGSHIFDPSRVQASLFLSDYGKDYKDGGFKLWNDQKTKYKLFGRDIKVKAGDLVLWRYSLPHEVSEINCMNKELGFMRIIYPLFDTDTQGD